jgi:hypothetical protein
VSWIELPDLIPKTVPTWPALTREQLDKWVVAVTLDAGEELVWLARMLATRSDDQLAHVFGLAPAVAAAR